MTDEQNSDEQNEDVEGHPRIRFEAEEQVQGHPRIQPPELVEGHSLEESGQERVTHDDSDEDAEGHGSRRPAPEE
jgi:hypothetical protein